MSRAQRLFVVLMLNLVLVSGLVGEDKGGRGDRMSTVYYCWVCQAPLSRDALSDTHYESERVIFFCSPRHWTEYQALKGL